MIPNIKNATPAVLGLLACAVLVFSTAAPAAAEGCDGLGDIPHGSAVATTLTSGETLVGRYAGCADGSVAIEHAILGTLAVPADKIEDVSVAETGEAFVMDVEVSAEPAEAVVNAVPLPAPLPEPVAEPEPSLWVSQAEFGLNGSQGNSERLAVRLGGRTKRTTEEQELSLDASYRRSDEESDGTSNTTENKAVALANNDWLFPGSPWRFFWGGTGEYDQLQEWDARLATSLGPAYEFINSETTLLIGRVGAGASIELGGEDESVIPELLFGYDFEHALSERQKIVSFARVYPNLDSTGDFRSIVRLAYDIGLATPTALSLRLGIEDRYDSTAADGTEKNDLDYYATLIWDF